MIWKFSAASAAIAIAVAFGASDPAWAGLRHGPHPAPGHNIAHPKGIAPDQGAGNGGTGEGGGGHHRHRNNQQQAANCGSTAPSEETGLVEGKTKKGKKKKDIQTACIDAK